MRHLHEHSGGDTPGLITPAPAESTELCDASAQQHPITQASDVPEPVAERVWLIVRAFSSDPVKQNRGPDRGWSDPRVLAWLDKHAIVSRIDVHTDPHAAHLLGLDQPTLIVAYRGEAEFDRVAGYLTASELLEWFRELEEGQRCVLMASQREPDDMRTGLKQQISDRQRAAQELVVAGQIDAAAQEYVQLWGLARRWEPTMGSVIAAPVVREIDSLLVQHAEARLRFIALRDEMSKRLDREKVVPDDLINWFALNRVLNDNETTLAWFDRARKERHQWPLVQRSGFMIKNLLVSRKRWADLVPIVPTPLEELQRGHDAWRVLHEDPPPTNFDPALLKYAIDSFDQYIQRNIGLTYAGLLAGSSDEVAADFADKANQLFETLHIRTHMVRAALDADEPRPIHLLWVRDDSSLQESVSASLRRKRDEMLRTIW